MQRMLALPVSQLEEELRASAERSAVLPPPDEEGPIYRRLAVDDLQPVLTGPETEVGRDHGSSRSGKESARDIPPAPSILLTTAGLPQEAERPAGTAVEEEESSKEKSPDWESELPASPEVLAAIRERRHESERSLKSTSALSLPDRSNASLPEPVLAWWIRPLVWCNQLFDHCTTWLGEPGEWLRSRQGRAVLGWSGLVLLAGAVTWIVLAGFG
jgi:hypothetical protein